MAPCQIPNPYEMESKTYNARKPLSLRDWEIDSYLFCLNETKLNIYFIRATKAQWCLIAP